MKNWNISNILFWVDNWTTSQPLALMLCLCTSQFDPTLKVADFVSPNSTWDIEKLNNYAPHLVTIIKAISLSSQNIPDFPIWGPTSNDLFSVKSATWLTNDLPTTNPWPFKWIWNLDISPKITIFLWQICHKAYPSIEFFMLVISFPLIIGLSAIILLKILITSF